MRFKGLAKFIYNNIPPPVNTRVGGMSLEDFTLRLMVWTIYLPQGIMAIRYRQHPFETWGRNVLVWLGGIAIVLLGKHPKYGFNAIFNQFMVPRQKLPKLPDGMLEKARLFKQNPKMLMEHLVNPLRPRENYLEIMREAGINLRTLGYKGPYTSEAMLKAVREKPFWPTLDINEKYKLHALRNMVRSASKRQAVENVIRRTTLCKYLSVGVSALLMAYLIGVALQKAVFDYIAPLDKRFKPRTKLNPELFEPPPYPGAKQLTDNRQRFQSLNTGGGWR